MARLSLYTSPALASCLLALFGTTNAYVLQRDAVLTSAANNSLPTNWTYIGCYNDTQNSRTLSGSMFADNKNMNGSACTAYCAKNNYVYAGTEYTDECYCGNKLGDVSSLQNDTSCNMPCAANSTEACGGPDFISIYFANKAAPQGPVTNPGPKGWTSYGCWTDGTTRTLSHDTATPGGASNMTVALCTTACSDAGYSLAGVEYAEECYCDNYLSSTATNASLTDCNMPCNGNSSEYCGAGNRLDLYALGTAVPGPKPSTAAPPLPANWVSLGCYSDSTSARSLSHGVAVAGGASNMTNANCIAACASAGYTIAGTEYSQECYCDNVFENDAAPVTDGRCSMPCNGDSNEICGGSNGLSVSQLNGTSSSSSSSAAPTTATSANDGNGGTQTTATSTATTPSKVSTPSSSVNQSLIAPFKYQGCYTDTGNGRSVTEQPAPDNQTMTVEYCVSVCSANGYTIAALQYGVQCFCDYFLHASPSLVDDSECNMACGGNSGEECGAGGRNSIYSNGTLADYVAPGPLTNATTPKGWTYSGCYADNTNNIRMFPYQLNYETNNSNTLCISMCQAFGYSAAGTEYADQCFCGDVSDMANYPAVKLDESDCFMRCRNDTDGSNGGEICGGGGSLSIYTWEQPFNQWSYASGNAAGAYEFLIGAPLMTLVSAPARNGKITFLEKIAGQYPAINNSGAYELDIASIDDWDMAWREMHVATNVFCSASLTLPDKVGRQLNVGGWANQDTYGIRIYWPDGSPGVQGTNDWQENPDELALLDGRWYPSAMTMANGSILVMGGEQGSNGAPTPTLELLPRVNSESQFCDYLNETDPNNLYPFLITLPSGNIFVGYYNQARLLDPVSLETVSVLPQMPAAVNDPTGGRTYPMEGTAVALPQYPPYTDLTVLVCGGSTMGAMVALDNCLTINPDEPKANWTLERMPSKRVMPCVAPLPDGTYLIVNGAHQGNAGFGLANDPNYNAILYDPTKPLGQRMTVMANTTVARLYHSEAVLLDDGRVLISGSDPENQDNKYPQEYRIEVFIPPYLMGNPTRPAFNLTNLDWGYGDTITLSITAPGAGGAYRVSLMGAVASTHGNSMGQRTFFPTTSCTSTSCKVTAPPNANVCPPAWFQVFLLDGAGVPSNAMWVRIGGDPGNLGNWPAGFDDFSTPGTGSVERLPGM